jgi:act minimal PKS acyl carrier protein
MPTITMDELRTMMRECTGVDDDVDLNADIADISFADLGYDSLAVLELIGEVSRRYDIPVPDEAVSEMPSPGAAVAFINRRLAEVRA